MPKKIIYDNFIGGLSTSDKKGVLGSYYVGREIDPYRNEGYLSPGFSATALSGTALISHQIVDISDVMYTGSQVHCYAIDNGGAGGTSATVYSINTDTDTVANTTSPDFPHNISHDTTYNFGVGLTLYEAKAASTQGVRMFYILDSNIGRFDFSGNFDDDYMSTVPVGAAGLTSNETHPHTKWNSLLYVGNGRYLARYDGTVGDGGEGTFNNQDLDLGSNWRITALFSTRHYLGICATERQGLITAPSERVYRSRSRVFLWDGKSVDTDGITTTNYSINIDDNVITAVININGTIYLFTAGRQPAGTLKVLGEAGATTLKFMKHDIAGTITDFDAPLFGGVDVYRGRVIFGAANQNVIMSYGREEVPQPFGLTFPWADYSAETSQIGALKTVREDKVYFSSKKGAALNLQRLNTGSSVNSQYKGLYTDFGQKVRVNYVKFFFKVLESGDDITPTLDLNYGETTATLTDLLGNTNISFANDGAVASKRFNVQRDCHSIRPVIDWTTGGVAISKIIIDYDVRPQDN